MSIPPLPPLPPKDLFTLTPQKSYSSEAMHNYAHAVQQQLLEKTKQLEELLVQCLILMQDVQTEIRNSGVTAPILDNCINKVTRILEKENERDLSK